jgi:predicted transcriptional regulator
LHILERPGGSREAIAELLGVTPQAISEGWNKGWTPRSIDWHRKKAGIEAAVSAPPEISLPA